MLAFEIYWWRFSEPNNKRKKKMIWVAKFFEIKMKISVNFLFTLAFLCYIYIIIICCLVWVLCCLAERHLHVRSYRMSAFILRIQKHLPLNTFGGSGDILAWPDYMYFVSVQQNNNYSLLAHVAFGEDEQQKKKLRLHNG